MVMRLVRVGLAWAYVLGLPAWSAAQVTLVGSVGTKIDSNTATHTLSSYALNASATLLLVRVGWQSTTTISSVTWNGSEALTAVGAEIEDSDSHKAQMFYRVSPTTTTANVVVVFSGAQDGSQIAVSGYSGVDTSTPIVSGSFASGQAAGPGGAASPASVATAASASAGDLTVSVIQTGTALTSSNTQDYQIQGTLFDTLVGAGSSSTSTGTVTMTWTYSGTHEWAMAVATLKASSGGGGGATRGLLTLGVGKDDQ